MENKKYVKPLKMFLFSIAAIILVMVATTSIAHAETPSEIVMVKGDSVLSYFELDGKTAFCIESGVDRPINTTQYVPLYSYENGAVLRLIKNYLVIQGSVDEEILNQVMQQAIWDTINETSSQRVLVIHCLGKFGVDIYDALMNGEAEIESTKVINMVVYGERTGEYQRLLKWTVEDAPVQVEPDTPEPVIPEDPIVEEIEPEVPIIENVKPAAPEIEEVEPSTPTIDEIKPEEPNIEETEPEEPDRVLDYPIEHVPERVPDTGVEFNIALYIILMITSAAIMMVIGRKITISHN